MLFTLLIIQGLVKLSLLILCLPCLAAVNRNLKMVFFQNSPCSLPQIPRGNGGWEGCGRRKKEKRRKRKGEGKKRENKERRKERGRKGREKYRGETKDHPASLGAVLRPFREFYEGKRGNFI